MAFVNLPPNFQDMFAVINDRIAKLETGPNQAMYTATAASTEAQAAYLQALSANALATQASYEAGVAVQSANGKTKTTYSTVAPAAGTPGSTGDIWFQVNSATGVVIGQYLYNGSAWIDSPIANTVIANLDAGKITAGTITGIAYNNGNGTFSVSSTGALVATSATVQGVIRGNSGYFTGTLNAGAGTIGGFNIGSNYLSTVDSSSGYRWNQNTGSMWVNSLNAAGLITAQTGIVLSTGGGALSMGTNNINNFGNANGASVTATGAISAGTTLKSTSAATATTTALPNCYISTDGTLLKTSNTSSQRYKENIVDISAVPALDPKKLLDLPVRAYNYKAGHIPADDERANRALPGFIAEEVDAIYPVAVDHIDGQAETYNGFWLIPAMLSLIQDQEARIKELESKIV